MSKASPEVSEFQIDIPEDEIIDLKNRLARTRWPDAETPDGWSQGLPLEYHQAFCKYWETDYDWYKSQKKLNQFPQFKSRFDGIDIYQPIDISEYEEGNYGDVPGQFRPSDWELPLIFRIGVALKPIKNNISQLTISADALHPNNNSESINIGCALDNTIPGVGVFSLRAGTKALFMDKPEYGYTAGLGFKLFYVGNKFVSVDYAYKSIGLLGNVNVYTLGFSF